LWLWWGDGEWWYPIPISYFYMYDHSNAFFSFYP
jgi:hypothetical protein